MSSGQRAIGFQWSRGVDAAETPQAGPPILTAILLLQWSRGVAAAETGTPRIGRNVPSACFNGAAASTPRKPAAIIPHDSTGRYRDERERCDPTRVRSEKNLKRTIPWLPRNPAQGRDFEVLRAGLERTSAQDRSSEPRRA